MDPSNPRNKTVRALIEIYECNFVMFKSITGTRKRRAGL